MIPNLGLWTGVTAFALHLPQMTSRIEVKPMTCPMLLRCLTEKVRTCAPQDKLHVKRVEMRNRTRSKKLIPPWEAMSASSVKSETPSTHTEPHQDINAGMAIFMGSQTTPWPGSLWCKISAARRALLEKPREELPHRSAALMPLVTLTEPQFRAASSAMTHATHVRPELRWLASKPAHPPNF